VEKTIKRGIVVPCTEEGRPFYEDFCKTVKCKYPILFSWEGVDRPHGSQEYGAVALGKEMFDEFILIHCTCLIKDNSLFDKLFEIPGHVALTSRFFHLMAKYVSADMPEVPVVRNKAEGTNLEVHWFTKPYTVFEPELIVHTQNFEEKHGRKNMILENDFLIKYKGHWGQ
jgi:hypothetical protein